MGEEIAVESSLYVLGLQWGMVLVGFGALLYYAPLATSAYEFFRGAKKHQETGFWALTASLVISWLFAKSIMNAADLGYAFGLVGGLAYATYYLSFLLTGGILYRLRTRFGATSLHQFLGSHYGRSALVVFSLLLAVRLLNEIWSNAMVIGLHFGPQGSAPYVLSIVVFTALTLGYTLKGGMKSSIFTDVIQMILFIGLLAFILGLLFPEMARQERSFLEGSVWSWATGLNLLLVALLQALSYGFHDPVMTDRGFLVRPKKALLAFGLAGILGALCIICFSFTGVFARGLPMVGVSPTVAVTRYFGIGMLLVVNAIMLTSAASTLDSTFTSFTKLLSRDLRLFPRAGVQISKGRQLMAVTAVLGSLPLLFSPSLLSASTISGTMVLGLGPVFLLPRKRAMHPLAFHLPVVLGFLAGLAVIFAPEESSWYFTTGPYAGLLFFNVLAFIGGFLLFVPLSYLTYDPRKNTKLATSGTR